MEMSLREWLIIAGIVIIAAVVVDGLRRVRRARRDSREIAAGMGGNSYSSPIDDDYNPELPGEVRVIKSGQDSSTESDLSEEEIPLVDDTVDQPLEPTFSMQDSSVPADPEVISQAGEELPDVPEDAFVATTPSHSAQQIAAPDPEIKADRTDRPPKATPATEDFKDRFLKKITSAQAVLHDTGKAKRQGRKPSGGKHAKSPKDIDEVIVVNVLQKGEEVFQGDKLQKLVEACGMQLGEMSIYHRHEYDFDKGPVQFSMANVMEPGTFETEMMDTPGVCFFIRLPGPDDSLQAFEYMVETAQAIVRNLGGELKDERHSVMTAQTIEHCRQRIREFERRKLSARV